MNRMNTYEGRRKNTCRFPIARIKKIMQFDEEIGKVSSSAPIVISQVIEMFLISLIKSLEEEAKKKSAKKIILSHLSTCIDENSQLEFLRSLFPQKKQ
ncbi:Dr1-associated corepressor [Nematocida sp. LUAm3]|nr:Dr1-associated corepressor [Nematocida sp. LUAm3]KAI5173854.1 Dr1-associated corepressor [Nematocida sp. LUAm2]KAI5177075.1 Dr1-associated corepressor [Nematocida sp. LUAm1]